MMSELLPQAAVMILIDRHKKSLLVIHKADFLRRHAGEIAFPGGKLESGESLLVCAQRECLEEVGIHPNQYTLLGELPQRVTRHDVVVTPFVAEITLPYTIKIDEGELQDAFFVSLDELNNPENHRQREAEINGVLMTLDYYAVHNKVNGEQVPHKIWGLTAHIMHDFLASEIIHGVL